MKTRIIKTVSSIALLTGVAAIGIASAADRAAADAKAAATGAAKATKALAHHDGAAAVAEAERAVGFAPRDAGYRLLLGQGYLAAGRFVSARTAFADALALAPTNGKAALNLVLTQVATGDWAGARVTLDEHGAGIAPADKGLALALAGDPAGAVRLLTQVARSPETSPKVRQNLALSLALAGEWGGARAVAAVDISPAEVDARLQQWAAFAHPRAASDQVAALLGVTPAEDSGQPVQLALNSGPSVAIAAVVAPVAAVIAAPAPADSRPAEAGPADARPAEAKTVEARPAPVEVAAVDPAHPGFAAAPVVFAPRAEVVQPLPVTVAVPRSSPHVGPHKVILDANGKATPFAGQTTAMVQTLQPRPEPMKVRLAPATPAAPASHGTWFVQFGAFESAAVARDGWARTIRRMPALAARGPSGASFTMNKTSFYRLSAGGFARPEADALCRRYRATGGACFVRAGAGDQVAAWTRKSVQLASR